MPRKSAMRDTVSAVRSRLPHLSNLSRESIELALLYYESNIEETVKAFQRDGAVEALSGWTEMTHDRGHNASKRANNKSGNRTNKPPSSETPPSNGVLRPYQRVSNMFQTFADGGVPTMSTVTITTNGNGAPLNGSFLEQSNSSLQSYPSDDLSFHPLLSQDSTTNNLLSSSNGIQTAEDNFHDTSNVTTSSSGPGDETSNPVNREESIDLTNGHHPAANHRETERNRQDSISSNRDRQSVTTDKELATNGSHASSTTPARKTVIKSLSSSSSSTTPFSDNRKVLTKSAKDLQRQTSTLSNVEMSFESEIKSSVKQIDQVFKQIRDIITEREVELYLEMDKVKEQGLTIIHRRQQRAIELRQRMDGCDRLEPSEIDHLRTDVKQFVTDRRYDLGEELTSSHRFEFDQTVIEALKHFGSVLRIDRPRTLSTSSALVETNGTPSVKSTTADKSPETLSTPSSNGRSGSAAATSANDQQRKQQPLPQRMNHRQQFNGYHANDPHSNSYSNAPTNGYHHYYDDQNTYQTVNRRRQAPPTQQQQQQQQQQYPPHPNGNSRRPRPTPSSNNNRRNGVQNSETTNTYRRPRPPQSVASPVPPISSN